MARVRLFAALRELAGERYLDVDGATVDVVVTALTEKFGEKFGQIARAGSAVVDGERAGWSEELAGDEEVALLPPVSGGGLSEDLMPRRPERVLLIVNPVARTVSRPVLDVIEKALSADFKLDVDETAERGHATALAHQAVRDDFDMVVVFSGDGTINEAVNAMAGTEVGLGIIPGGATNVLARALGIPQDPVEATGVLIGTALAGRRRRLNLGKANGRYFTFACGVGIDAAAMARVEARRPVSKKAFEWRSLASVVREGLRHAGLPSDLRVRVDGGEPLEAVSVLVGRTNPYTFFKRFGVKVTPGVKTEGGLDVLTVRRLTRRALPRVAYQVLISGRVNRRRNVAYAHDATSVEVTGRAPFPVQLDGDYLGLRDGLSVRLERGALWAFA